MIDREKIERRLYWFLTREPTTKIVFIIVLLFSVLVTCSICYSTIRATLFSVGSTSISGSSSPTDARAAQLPATYTPLAYSSVSGIQDSSTIPNQHNSIVSLTENSLGSRIRSGSIYHETYARDLDGNGYPGGRIGYDVQFVLSTPGDQSREELLTIAYTLFHEFYFNFSDKKPMFLMISLRAYQNDVFGGCVLGAGIGHQAVSAFLPSQQPSDLETWFRSLRNSKYYGDLSG